MDSQHNLITANTVVIKLLSLTIFCHSCQTPLSKTNIQQNNDLNHKIVYSHKMKIPIK